MNPYATSFFISALGLGTALTFSSSHWLLAWMGLEISTLAILPLMTQEHSPRAVEAAAKYFIIQAAAAAIIMFASTTNAWLTGSWDILHLYHPVSATFVFMALALKVGLAPAHFWLPEVTQGLSLTTGLILSTWQKLAPLVLILQVTPTLNPTLVQSMAVTSMLVGGWGGMSQTQIRKILAYSSIAHLGWIVIVSQMSPYLTLLALTMYIVLTTATFLAMKMSTVYSFNTLATAWTKTPGLAALTSLTLLSLGGLPPLSGFMSKWLILRELTNQGLPLIASFAALTALLSLYFYLRICYAMALTAFPHTSGSSPAWRLPSNQTSLLLAAAIISALQLLPITPCLLSMCSGN
uniref:NADH-ubiquinone oxidoreductase chain 2 n=2 Tax=Neosalanx TaxID=182235 RepID=K4JU54_NEOTA|nr:NADH dehydrogenase subunit 2 [Neosalanx taihuensis]YP_009121434.1 NADH dehydrogenase subunit 2 [Neosalanx tangkahkeii]AFU89129.1 NADH dehydrogenase subunit 2 [Neosalanx taihuensis]AJF41793.1 NADH dehydrogenase subunit 2 [Neosalanx tangkahkeii]